MGVTWRRVAACLVLMATACASESVSTSSTTSSTVAPTAAHRPTPIHIRIDRRVADAATDGFEALVEATLTDPGGWQAADFQFVFTGSAPYTIVLAEGDVVDELCRPYDVGGRYSCQIGPVVALNADRWRTATPQWTGDLLSYRQMLVNHEVGHLLGQHHPQVRCPAPGRPAPVMAQQSTVLGGCLPNPWPLPWEIACAARRLEPLAPGYEPNPTPLCGPES